MSLSDSDNNHIILGNVDELINDVDYDILTLDDLNSMIYRPIMIDQYDDTHDDNDPTVFLTNTRNINIPLSMYVSHHTCPDQSLSVMSYNIRSVPFHFDTFRENHAPTYNVLALSETRLIDD